MLRFARFVGMKNLLRISFVMEISANTAETLYLDLNCCKAFMLGTMCPYT